jgi:hypothetical protein
LRSCRITLDIDQLVKEERGWNCRKGDIFDLVHFSRDRVDKTERSFTLMGLAQRGESDMDAYVVVS